MQQFIVRYKVEPDQAEHNAELIRDVYTELEQTSPEGFHYGTFRLDDGGSRSSTSLLVRTAGTIRSTSREAFHRFSADIRERCDEEPVTTAAHEVARSGSSTIAARADG